MPIRSIDDYLQAMQANFNPAAAGTRSAVLQYDFTGEQCGVCHAVISGGTIQVARGPHPAPTVIVHADFNYWLRVSTHEVDALMAYQAGEYTIEGDVITLMDSDLWFGHS